MELKCAVECWWSVGGVGRRLDRVLVSLGGVGWSVGGVSRAGKSVGGVLVLWVKLDGASVACLWSWMECWWSVGEVERCRMECWWNVGGVGRSVDGECWMGVLVRVGGVDCSVGGVSVELIGAGKNVDGVLVECWWSVCGFMVSDGVLVECSRVVARVGWSVGGVSVEMDGVLAECLWSWMECWCSVGEVEWCWMEC